MNAFWLDEDLRQAARFYADQHVGKMLLEAAQVCCTAARIHGYDDEFLYQKTHVHHPLVHWASESRANWDRLFELARALDSEFRERFDHDESHASWRLLERLDRNRLAIPLAEPTSPPQCMPEQYRRPGDVVAAYRAYYANEKADRLRWSRAPEPPWLDAYRIEEEDDTASTDATSPSPADDPS